MPELPTNCYLSLICVKGMKLTSGDQNYLPRKVGNIRVNVKYFLPKVTHGLVLRKKEYIDEVIVR
jgi:hypothetical protein